MSVNVIRSIAGRLDISTPPAVVAVVAWESVAGFSDSAALVLDSCLFLAARAALLLDSLPQTANADEIKYEQHISTL